MFRTLWLRLSRLLAFEVTEFLFLSVIILFYVDKTRYYNKFFCTRTKLLQIIINSTLPTFRYLKRKLFRK